MYCRDCREKRLWWCLFRILLRTRRTFGGVRFYFSRFQRVTITVLYYVICICVENLIGRQNIKREVIYLYIIYSSTHQHLYLSLCMYVCVCVCVCVYCNACMCIDPFTVYTKYIYMRVNDNGFFFLLPSSQNCRFSCPVLFGLGNKRFFGIVWFTLLYTFRLCYSIDF